MGAEKALWEADLSGPVAIVVGSESDGLGADWEAELAEKVKIPMGGISDSLNVNVAASIFLYESLPQKNARFSG